MRIKQHDKSYIVELADGSAWRIWPGDIAARLQWNAVQQDCRSEIDDQFCTHALIDRTSGTRVRVIEATANWSPEDIRASFSALTAPSVFPTLARARSYPLSRC